MKKKNTVTFLSEIRNRRQPGDCTPCTGRIVGTDDNGNILVSYGRGACNPARLTASLKRHELAAPPCHGREVLLIFENNDATKPIIMALMDDPSEDMADLAMTEQKPQNIQVDGQTVTIEATGEIILKCGPGSIHLTKEGTIILKGIEIISRARVANKIKGGKVEAN